MANPVCSKASLLEAVGNGQNAITFPNRRQYEAALVYLKVLELAAIGGTDYTATMETDLIDDAIQLTKTMDPNQRRMARLNIARNAAIQSGAVPETGVSGLSEATGCCLQNYPDLDGVLLLLDCQLGRHADYPQ